MTIEEARELIVKLGNRWSDWCGFGTCHKGVLYKLTQISPGHVEDQYWPCVCNIGWPMYENTEEYYEKFDKRDYE